MPNIKHLNQAKSAKNDEFFTQYEDIEKECQYYSEDFKDKCIYLPCDEEKSNFWKYFVDNFHNFKLKHLTATHIDFNTNSYRLDYNGTETIKTALEGNGDFRSEECTKIKNDADIIITNEPFSLFRDFVYWLFGGVFEKVDNKYIRKVENIRFDYDKKFLIIGNMNAVTYKEIFPYIKNNQLWLGVSISSGDRRFDVPKTYDLNAATCGIDEKGIHFIRVKGVRWFTNIDNKKRNTPLDLYKKYTPEEYPQYDNYFGIEVSKVCDIPMDYDGVMGVPITFLDKYCSTQFEIVGIAKDGRGHKWDLFKPFINGKPTYARILIKKRDNQ